MSKKRTHDFTSKAREFVDSFVADLKAFDKTGLPISQSVNQRATIQIDRSSNGVEGTILVPYIGGTIACEDMGNGLEPQPVESFDAFLDLQGIDPRSIKNAYPKTNFKWVAIPPALDSGTMDEIDRIDVVSKTGKEAQKVVKEGKFLMGILPIHGTDSAIKTCSRLAEVYACSPIPTNMLTAQDPPGTFRGDGRRNTEDSLDLLHAGVAGHFAVSAGGVYIPFDSAKTTDHGHEIYGQGAYGYGHFATMDATSLTIQRGLIRQRSNDPSLMPWQDERLMHHYRRVDTTAQSYMDPQSGMCLEIPADALRDEVFEKTRKAEDDSDHHLYALIESQGASNTNEARQEFLDVATESGICSIVVSEVAGATDASPYAAGAKSSTHVTIISPDTNFDQTRAKFYLSAAWTERVLEAYDVSNDDAAEIRPLLFRELYKRQRGYDAPFIPGGGRTESRIQDYTLQRWAKSQVPTKSL